MTDKTDYEDLNDVVEASQEPSELEVLQARADKLGIKYHPKAGVTKLKTLIDKELNGEENSEETETPVEELTDGQKRLKAVKEAGKLVRVNVSSRDPNKKQWDGEVITVANAVAGKFSKFVKFDTTEGWHIPNIIYKTLKNKKVQLFKTERLPNGETKRTGYLAPAYAIEVLPSLTEQELKELAADQRARNAVE